MQTPALTVRVFGWYLIFLSAALVIVPNPFLAVVGAPPATDVWVRVTGMLVGFLGYYYIRAAAAGITAFFAWSVPARFSVMIFFGAFVAFGLAPAVLLVFGLIDAAAAAWTWLAIRKSQHS